MISHYIGKAGEYAVASQLLLRGIPVCFPAVDGGVDLVAGNGIRIQVKTARRTSHQNRASCYYFNIRATKLKDRKFYKARRDWTEFVDFFVFCGIDENRFWIMPSALVKQGSSVILGEISNRHSVDQEAAKALVATGLDQRQAAKRLGISEMSVSRAVRDLKPKGTFRLTYEAAKRENAWHEIISAASLVNQVEAAHLQPKEILS